MFQIRKERKIRMIKIQSHINTQYTRMCRNFGLCVIDMAHWLLLYPLVYIVYISHEHFCVLFMESGGKIIDKCNGSRYQRPNTTIASLPDLSFCCVERPEDEEGGLKHSTKGEEKKKGQPISQMQCSMMNKQVGRKRTHKIRVKVATFQ